MQAYLLFGPISIDVGGGGGSGCGSGGVSSFIKGSGNFLVGTQIYHQRPNHVIKRPGATVVASAAINSKQNHYDVLGIPCSASSVDIKRAYRLLARKYHPDVSKESHAGETFKSIRLAYDVLSNTETRAEYDYKLKFHKIPDIPLRRSWSYSYTPEYEEDIRLYKWEELRRQSRRQKHYEDYESTEEEEESNIERSPFSEMLAFTFFVLFFMQTIGTQLTLMLCTLTALLDKKLDGGYKMGYLFSWILGGRGGVLLMLSLSFASWMCGKASSGVVAVVVVAMWVGTSVARFAPMPRGALIALLYMSIKLQVGSS